MLILLHRDALRRHEALHRRVHGDSTTSVSNASKIKTCTACAKARIRCIGGPPCGRCARRGDECLFPLRKRREGLANRSSEVDPASSGSGPATVESDISSNAGNVQDNSIVAAVERPDHPTVMQWSGIDQFLPTCTEDTNAEMAYGDKPANPDLPSGATDLRNEELYLAEFNTAMPDVPTHNFTDTNWLPFDDASIGSFPFESPKSFSENPRTGHVQVVATTAKELERPAAQDFRDASNSGQDDTDRRNRVTALINSMRQSITHEADTPLSFDGQNSDPELKARATLYADGVGYRSSRSNRRKAGHNIPNGEQKLVDDAWPESLSTLIQSTATDGRDHSFEIPKDVYGEIILRSSSASTESYSAEFLAHRELLFQKKTLNYLIEVYFNGFHKVYPFLDRSLLCIPVWGWSLCFATAAVGLRILPLPIPVSCGDDMARQLQELLTKEVLPPPS